MNEINDTNIGEFYTKIYERRFKEYPQEGYEELAKIMEDKTPSLAYAILAQILAQGQHQTVLTTNFDFLVEDAVRMYTDSKPFVVGHESLAGFIQFHKKRPTIIKVHRDLFLEPQNTSTETSHLKTPWKVALAPLFNEYRVLVLGYGGNDDSLMDYLKYIKPEERQSVYWCIRRGGYINKKIESILTERDYVIEIDGFDELMYDLLKQLEIDFCKNLDIPEEHQFMKTAKKRMQNLNDKLIELAIKSKYKDLKNMLSGVSEIIYNADQAKADKSEEIYQSGMKKYPENIHLLNEYAIFLTEQEKFDEANKLYERIIEINSDSEYTYSNWGRFFKIVGNTKKGLESESLYNQAFEKYEKAIQLNPYFEEAYCNWGCALDEFAETKEGKEAETLYSQAFEKYEKAIQENSNYEIAYNNWGNALVSLAGMKENDEAESLYRQAFEKFKKAIQINSDYEIAYSNWGNALYEFARTKENKEAETLYNQAFKKYEKAIQVNPDNVYTYYYLAWWLAQIGDKKNALKYLEHCLVNKYIDITFVEKDTCWDIFSDDEDFIVLLKRYMN